MLFTLPNADAWFVPDHWHTDSPRLPNGARPGVQLFAFLDEVAPGGGGTLALAGSHRLLDEGRFIRPRDIRRLLGREPFFRTLFSHRQEERLRAFEGGGAVGDVPLQGVELTGAPGDAYFMDLRVLHAGAPNASARPRMMITDRFGCADCVAMAVEGFGWRKDEPSASISK